MNEKDLINWSNLSVLIAGSRQNVRKTNTRPIYRQQVEIFTSAMRRAMDELRDHDIKNQGDAE